jgi:hypothetical protein
MSPRRELLRAEPGPKDRDDRTNKPLLSLRISGNREAWLFAKARFGLELAYLMGDDSTMVSFYMRKSIESSYHR